MISFTNEQKAVFDFISNGQGNGMIEAVAGAGKTTTLLEAARYIPCTKEVLFCAFNKSVSMDIMQRARSNGLNNVCVRTVHALGWRIINENKFPSSTVKRKYQMILASQEEMVNQYLDKVLAASNVPDRSRIEYYRNNPSSLSSMTPAQMDRYTTSLKLCTFFSDIVLVCVDRVRQTLTNNVESDFRKMVRHYGVFKNLETSIPNINDVVDILRELTFRIIEIGIKVAEFRHEIDFNDMLYLPHIWDLHPITRYSYCFVDECQDLSVGQIEIIQKCLEPGARVLAVGDPNQSICSFSGADTKSFQTMKRYLSAKVFTLSGCFRCSQSIISEAQTIRPDITGIRTEKGQVEHISFDDALGSIAVGDMVVSRNRDPLIRAALRLVENEIPIRIHTNELPSVMSEMKSLFNKNDFSADLVECSQSILESARHRGYSEAERRYRKVQDRDLKATLVGAFRDKVDMYIDFVGNNWNKWGGMNLSNFFYRLEEKLSGRYLDCFVRLMSIHSSKGLEENRVFILDYDKLPEIKEHQQIWAKEQETNIKYVAVTRAKDELYLVRPIVVKKWNDQLSLFD